MKVNYIAPDAELLHAVPTELVCQSPDGILESFQDDGEFVW